MTNYLSFTAQLDSQTQKFTAGLKAYLRLMDDK